MIRIEFTLISTSAGTSTVVRRRVDVQHGKLLRITDCAGGGDETQAASIISDPAPPRR